MAVLLLLLQHVEAFRPSSPSGPQRPLLHPSTALATQVAAAGTRIAWVEERRLVIIIR